MSLLGYHNSDGTAVVGHLLAATKGYGSLVQRRIVAVLLNRYIKFQVQIYYDLAIKNSDRFIILDLLVN
jgi:hypothetical protein